jgi:DNA ligase-1
MSKAKQTDIASFFGGKPKAAAPKPAPKAARAAATAAAAAGDAAGGSAGASPAPKRKPEEPAGAAAAPAPPAELKRLRKAGGGAAAAAPAASPAAAAALEDASGDEAPAPRGPLVDTAPVAAAEAAAADAAAAESDAEAAELAAGGSDGESDSLEVSLEEESDLSASDDDGEAAAGPSAKPAKGKAGGAAKGKAGKKAPKSPAAKEAGVGALAVKAAELYAACDVGAAATWPPGAPVPFAFLAETFEAIGDEPKRLAITALLVRAFRAALATTPEDLLPMVYLCSNAVAPGHEGLELGIGDATLVKALAQATGRQEARIRADYDATGDLGRVAAAARATQRTLGFSKPAPLTVRAVFAAFREIAAAAGKSSQDRKKGMIVRLLVGASQTEAGFIVRALQGKLRIGLAEQTVLAALAHAVLLQRERLGDAAAAAAAGASSPEALAAALERGAQTLKRVFSECPSFDELVPALLAAPVADLPARVHFKCGVPVRPMLAKPMTGVSEVLDKFADQPFTCEYKYDGERAQVHVLESGEVRVYSRNMEDNTGKYPDVAALFPAALAPGVRSVVLDAEVVAWDAAEQKVKPFQVLSTRARKNVTVESVDVPVCLFAFDCLFLDGRALLAEPLTARRAALAAALVERPGALQLATYKTSADVEELSAFLDESVAAGTEGLIVKTLGDAYEPSRRSSHWLKLKKDYMDGVADTFDLVPIGAWHGRGKRTGVYGAYLLAIWDPEAEEFQAITKIGTGFSEALLAELAGSMAADAIPAAKPYYRTGDAATPDVWFDAKRVWEVKAADLSISPAYPAAAGRVDDAKGISIRFPRLVRVREDKGPEDSTSPEQVAEMYGAQASVRQAGKKGGGGGGDE